MNRFAVLRALMTMEPGERRAELAAMDPLEREEMQTYWRLWAREGQLPPPGNHWRQWLVMAGRGFGKTRAGAEWVRAVARRNPDARIALVGSTLAEVRNVMVEGDSGLIAIALAGRVPVYESSLRRLSWPNGAQAFLYAASDPEALRGPQHHAAWCDEIAKWDTASDRAMRCWDNMLLSLRLGERPRVVATTTPRAVPLLRRLLAETSDGSSVVTRGRTADNHANLPAAFLAEMARTYGGTTLGRQELGGELLEEVEGALWSRALLDRCRLTGPPPPRGRARRRIVAVDPPASATGDACGIVVAELLADGTALVRADCTVERASPERWARAVADTARIWGADRVVAEANQGGAMVETVLRAAEVALPVRLVRARRGKVARAEPVAALYEAGRVRHAGLFARLEDEMCGLMTGGAYHGPGRSPDRADALVWALTELMLAGAGEPRVRSV